MSGVESEVVDLTTLIEKVVNTAVQKAVPEAVSILVHDMGFRLQHQDKVEWLRMEDYCKKYSVSASSVFVNVRKKRIQKRRLAGGTYYRPVIQNID